MNEQAGVKTGQFRHKAAASFIGNAECVNPYCSVLISHEQALWREPGVLGEKLLWVVWSCRTDVWEDHE